MKNLEFFLICLTFLLFQSCTDSTTGPQKDTEIIFGESIEGIFIGDDSLTVIKKLGIPTQFLDGDFSGYIFFYQEGKLKYTSVFVSNDPALGLGVIEVIVDMPYMGKSKEGIGIGSNRDFVIDRIGNADTTLNYTPLYDIYFYDKNEFEIAYENQSIVRISMSKIKLYW